MLTQPSKYYKRKYLRNQIICRKNSLPRKTVELITQSCLRFDAEMKINTKILYKGDSI